MCYIIHLLDIMHNRKHISLNVVLHTLIVSLFHCFVLKRTGALCDNLPHTVVWQDAPVLGVNGRLKNFTFAIKAFRSQKTKLDGTPKTGLQNKERHWPTFISIIIPEDGPYWVPVIVLIHTRIQWQCEGAQNSHIIIISWGWSPERNIFSSDDDDDAGAGDDDGGGDDEDVTLDVPLKDQPDHKHAEC